jgi:hypothetical protein
LRRLDAELQLLALVGIWRFRLFAGISGIRRAVILGVDAVLLGDGADDVGLHADHAVEVQQLALVRTLLTQ